VSAVAAEMEGEEIGLVLARASDLRARISACAAAARPEGAAKRLGAARGGGEGEDDEQQEEEEVDSLVGIGDALESLERQLASLQVCPSVCGSG
jgi:ribosomal protein L12E/L44/L45/RPP1/RPP2